MRTKSEATPLRSARPRATNRASSSRQNGAQYLFVYGTLKRGGRFHRQLKDEPGVELIGDARIRGQLYQLPGEDYPGAVPTKSDRYVHGQLYSIKRPRKTLGALDEFEGVSEGLFRRKLVDAWMSRKRARAWVYFYAGPIQQANLVSSGVYS